MTAADILSLAQQPANTLLRALAPRPYCPSVREYNASPQELRADIYRQWERIGRGTHPDSNTAWGLYQIVLNARGDNHSFWPDIECAESEGHDERAERIELEQDYREHGGMK